MHVAPSNTTDRSHTGSDIRGCCVIESDPSRSSHRYPNPDPLIFDYLTRFCFLFEQHGSTVKESHDRLRLQTGFLIDVKTTGPKWAKLGHTGPNWALPAWF